MSAWSLVPCLVRLRADFDTLAPSRDHASDGSVADAAHSPSSDHSPDEDSPALRNRDADNRNEVHAVDVDADLRTDGVTMEQCVLHIVGRCRTGAEQRLQYVIFNRRIWSAAWGWTARPYTGANPHDQHAHFSARYETAWENDARTWHLEELPIMLTPQDKAWLLNAINEAATIAAERVWATRWRQAGTGPEKSAATMLAYVPSAGQVDRVRVLAEKVLDAVEVDGAAQPHPAG